MYLDDCIFLKCCYDRILLVCSPRMWRWSYCTPFNVFAISVFSTYVEMILRLLTGILVVISVLHVCGDDPFWNLKQFSKPWCSPRMWRWSYSSLNAHSGTLVFSTYVEMILSVTLIFPSTLSVLHVCGDDPKASRLLTVASGCSPRMWRWSYDYDPYLLEVEVFSTYVEMILTRSQFPLTMLCVLHVCGDDPIWLQSIDMMLKCSPRMWRWSYNS